MTMKSTSGWASRVCRKAQIRCTVGPIETPPLPLGSRTSAGKLEFSVCNTGSDSL
eukprot:CAMPEP_0195045568 /NCGR_PEP_ID=MMETSP0347-20130606/16789_1 /TAXON_ID=2932 /ORGANISM="Alexandrium fundyense, Strain CCMP1719" /LENGTH=54 /DNA_ID=CAMNT_0040073423 /DNA_START=68 /DNA_END=228 /DNA_ORIENTATION=-